MYLGEDSFFLSEVLKKQLKSKKNKNKEIKILDMGTGTGIQAETCIKLGFKKTLACDINKEAVAFVKKKRIKAIQSNLFSKLSKKKFDLIIFNAPYLPAHKYDEQKDTTGGKLGDETILRFLKQARKHLTPKGEILLLLSSLTPKNKINLLIKKDYQIEELAEKPFFFEKLQIWKLRLR